MEQIQKEALSASANCCEVVAAELGEQIGDYAAIAAALILSMLSDKETKKQWLDLL